jgi:cbb3-type cytochrome oxidase cytochrome c subunit
MNKKTKFLSFIMTISGGLISLVSISIILVILVSISIILAGYSSKANANSIGGASLFKSEGCIACHTIDGKGGKVGPDLSYIGSNNLSYHWMKEQLVDPAAHFRSNIMPSYKSMPLAKIDILVNYLESLK